MVNISVSFANGCGPARCEVHVYINVDFISIRDQAINLINILISYISLGMLGMDK